MFGEMLSSVFHYSSILISSRTPYHFRAKEKLELVHGDLCGPVTPATPGGRALLPAARRRRVPLHVGGPARLQGSGCRRHQVAAEECGRKLRVLRTDNGGEFTAAEFAAYCADEGSNATSPCHTPRSRTALWSAATRQWWPLPAPSSSKEGCRQSTGGRR